MTTTNQKLEIIRSLNTLDAAQADKVLSFINGMLRNERHTRYHQYVKRKAIREIGRALQQNQATF